MNTNDGDNSSYTEVSDFCADGKWAGEVPQTEHSTRTKYHRTQAKAEGHRQRNAPWTTKGKVFVNLWLNN